VESVREWREAKEEELKADILAVAIKSDSAVDERRISIRYVNSFLFLMTRIR